MCKKQRPSLEAGPGLTFLQVYFTKCQIFSTQNYKSHYQYAKASWLDTTTTNNRNKVISAWKHILWVLIRGPSLRVSNEYPQHMFLWGNKEKGNLANLKPWDIQTDLIFYCSCLHYGSLLPGTAHFILSIYKPITSPSVLHSQISCIWEAL